MKQSVLIIIKPDGMAKQLAGVVLTRFAETGLSLVGLKLVEPRRELLEEHYGHLKNEPFFEKNIQLWRCGENFLPSPKWSEVVVG